MQVMQLSNVELTDKKLCGQNCNPVVVEKYVIIPSCAQICLNSQFAFLQQWHFMLCKIYKMLSDIDLNLCTYFKAKSFKAV